MVKSACELRIRQSNGTDGPTTTMLGLSIGKGNAYSACCHELVSGSHKNGGRSRRPTTQNHQAKRRVHRLRLLQEFHGDPNQCKEIIHRISRHRHWHEPATIACDVTLTAVSWYIGGGRPGRAFSGASRSRIPDESELSGPRWRFRSFHQVELAFWRGIVIHGHP